jgi:branched-chain amino acid aminotransferase
MAFDPIQQLTRADIEARADSLRRPWHSHFYAMYSSVLGGIVTDPLLMQIPADDHLAHRGDGVFETLKCVDGAVYALHPHLERLHASADAIRLRFPVSDETLAALIRETLVAGGHRQALIRLILSRGPGGFGVSPTECPAPGVYIIVYRLPPSFMDAHPAGARAARSDLPVKPSSLATIKTCNYLLNALLAQAADAAGVDFVLGFDEAGEATESATENFGLVTRDRDLVLPLPGRLLEGITMNRVMELARSGADTGFLREVRRAALRESDLLDAAEILIFGTTKDVTSVTVYGGRQVGDGKPGPVRNRLHQKLLDDIRSNPEMRTPCFD